MAEMWKPHSIEIYQSWIETIIDEAVDQLTDWETNFIDSIATRLFSGYNLTQAQAEALEKIYSAKTK